MKGKVSILLSVIVIVSILILPIEGLANIGDDIITSLESLNFLKVCLFTIRQ